MNNDPSMTIQISGALTDVIADKVIERLLPIINAKEPDKIMSIDELSKFIGKLKDQIYQWVNQSQHDLSAFPYLKAGQSLRFSRKDIVQWMKSNGKPLEIPSKSNLLQCNSLISLERAMGLEPTTSSLGS